MPQVLIENATVSVAPPRWKTLYFNVQNFKDLPTTTDHYVETPIFSCNEHEWSLRIYPGGDEDADEGYVSIYLHHRSEGSITANYQVMIVDKFGKAKANAEALKTPDRFEGDDAFGEEDFIKRSEILDKSSKILDSHGTLRVVISMKEKPTKVFVPENPLNKMIQGMFLNEDTADVCFEVCRAELKGKQKRAKSSDLFHAHNCILKTCAPMLANLFGSNDSDSDGKLATVTITDVKPDIFRHLLYYVYGGSVPDGELKKRAKDIIDAADKYSIINLKLEAEIAYVKSTKITMENAMDNLLYADAKNCALLKEAVMNFLAENSAEAYAKISFTDFPGHVVKDLLLAVSNKEWRRYSGATTEELTTLSVSALRSMLAEKGLDVDGSREAMIESIKNHS